MNTLELSESMTPLPPETDRSRPTVLASPPSFSLTPPMRPALALWVYLLFVFAGGAMLAPLVHEVLSNHTDLARIPFRRIVARCLLMLALLGLWPFVKALGIRSFQDIG